MADEIVAVYRAEVEQYKKAMDELVGRVDKLDKEQKNVSKGSEAMGAVMKKVGGVIAAAFSIQAIGRFGEEVVRLAAQAEGVERAFRRIGSPQLLEGLRKATRGTVSDLQLMQNAVKASNFDIPLKNLAQLFRFAQARARETGESVDYLVDSIILGIGRKSPLILDNLGISAIQLRQKFGGLSAEAATVGDVAQAVGEIAEEELKKMGVQADTAADSMTRLSASTENLKIALGKLIVEEGAGVSTFFSNIADAMTLVLTENERLAAELSGQSGLKILARLREEQAKLAELEAEASEKIGRVREAEAAKILEAIDRQRSLIEAIKDVLAQKRQEGGEYDITTEKIDKAIQAYRELQEAQGGEIITLHSLNEELKLLRESLDNAEVGSTAFFEAGEKIEAKANEIEAALRSLRLAGIEDAGLTLLDPKAIDQISGVSLKQLNEQLSEARRRKEEAFEFSEEFNQAIMDIDALEQRIKGFGDVTIETGKKAGSGIAESFANAGKSSAASTDYAKDLMLQGLSTASSIYSSINQLADSSAQFEMQMWQERFEEGLITREELEQKERQLQRQSAQRAKDAATFNAIIGAAQAAINALSSPGVPFPVALAFSLFAAATAGVQVAAIQSTPLPQFEEGGIIKGKRHSKGGEIIEAEGGEFITNRIQTAKNRQLLEAINSGNVDSFILQHYVRPAIDGAVLSGMSDIGKSAELNGLTATLKDHNIISAVDRMRQSNSRDMRQLIAIMGRFKNDNPRKRW